MKFLATLIIIVAALVAVVAVIPPLSPFFAVDETQYAVVLRFGEATREIKSPGLKFKTPLIDSVIYLDNRLQVFDAPAASLLTKDKKNLVIDVYARGRISEPQRFLEEVGSERSGRNRATEIVASELRREVALDNQSEIIHTSREQVMNRIRDAVRPKLEQFGIEVVDVRIKRADFPDTIESSVHDRMKAERQRIADRERAAGSKRDSEVKADVDRQATIIRSSAQRDADIIRGCADADATRIFADALQQDPEFYTFLRSLEAAKKYLPENTTVYGSADEWGKILESIRESAAEAARAPAGTADESPDDTALSVCEELDVQLAARRLLSEELEISGSGLILLETVGVNWPSASLCEKEGESSDQVVTPGYRVTFEYEGATYVVHSGKDGSTVANCTPPAADAEVTTGGARVAGGPSGARPGLRQVVPTA